MVMKTLYVRFEKSRDLSTKQFMSSQACSCSRITTDNHTEAYRTQAQVQLLHINNRQPKRSLELELELGLELHDHVFDHTLYAPYLAYPVHVYCVCLGEASGAVSGKFRKNSAPAALHCQFFL